MSNDPSEMEFLAENENIRIVPNFSLDELLLIQGTLGPFHAGLPIQVPIWLAINLRQRSKCRVLIPDWMDVAALQQIKDEELVAEHFTKMPSEHYMVLGKILFETCAGEMANADEIRTLLKDIWDIRASKFKKSIEAFLEEGRNYAKVNNLTQMEISSVRPFFPHALEQIFRLTRDLNNAVSSSESSSQSSQSQSQSSGGNDSQNTLGASSMSMSMEVDSQSQS